jgi:hypothetical protein
LTERNGKDTAEADGLTQENQRLQGEVLRFQETLSQFNASLQKVKDF